MVAAVAASRSQQSTVNNQLSAIHSQQVSPVNSQQSTDDAQASYPGTQVLRSGTQAHFRTEFARTLGGRIQEKQD